MLSKAPQHDRSTAHSCSGPEDAGAEEVTRRYSADVGGVRIDAPLARLSERRGRWAAMSIAWQIELAEATLQGVADTARDWVDTACRIKGIPDGSPSRAEEVLTGPVITARYLQLLIQTLRDIQDRGAPRFGGRLVTNSDGRLHVPVVPARGLCDPLTFMGCRAYVRMQAGVTEANLKQYWAVHHRASERPESRIVAVLGAGNVSSIPITDSLSKLFTERKLVLLKMHPLNEALGPVFERALAPLIDSGVLQIVYGDAEIGKAAVNHKLVDEVHLTGSVEAHDAIVWGPPGLDRQWRIQNNRPLLSKPVSSELGNVSPWIFVPGRYSKRQLRYQAANVAASFVNNASFNCAATRVLITSRNWPDRDRFLDLLQGILERVPRRKAYYPGAEERYRRFSGRDPEPGEPGTLPWTLLRDVNPAESPVLLTEESFTTLLAEVALDAPSDRAFLEAAVDFANERLWGTLCATLTVPPELRKEPEADEAFQTQLHRLSYGAIGINQWPGLIYALVGPPWGGFPGGTLANPQSGLGWVHNAYMLSGIDQTILDGPLTSFPRPIWFPTHRRPEPVAWKLFDHYCRPSLSRCFDLTWAAMMAETHHWKR